MKSIFTVLILAVLSHQAQAFFPSLNCRGNGPGVAPLNVQYIDDGMITISHGWSSCELDVNLSGDAGQEWIRFNNNNGSLNNKLLNTRCKPVLFSMFFEKRDILTDIQWLDLSRKVIDDGGNGELEFPAKLYYFINTGSGPGPIVFEQLSCKVAD